MNIEGYAFESCNSLENIKLPTSLKNLGASAFSNCGNLRSIKIPGTIETIQVATFKECVKLENVEFEYGVKEIYEEAFYRCSSLTHVEFPTSMETIGRNRESAAGTVNDGPFEACSSLSSISLNERASRHKTMLISWMPDRECNFSNYFEIYSVFSHLHIVVI